jgi:hypothetical protein
MKITRAAAASLELLDCGGASRVIDIRDRNLRAPRRTAFSDGQSYAARASRYKNDLAGKIKNLLIVADALSSQ